MPTIKVRCTPVVTSEPVQTFALNLAPPPPVEKLLFHKPSLACWEDHPALKTAFDCLNIYNHWVSQRVIPIAFQWIAEHRLEVYDHVAPKQYDDVGAVIAAAFHLIQSNAKYNSEYNASLATAKEIENRETDPSLYNPMWAGVASELELDISNAFEQHEDALRKMIQQTYPETIKMVAETHPELFART